MENLKTYLLFSGGGYEEHLELKSEKLKIPLELKVCDDNYVPELPKDYDLYILDLSAIDIDNVKELKQEQPWSYFVALGNGGMFDEQSKKTFDECKMWLTGTDLERLLKRRLGFR